MVDHTVLAFDLADKWRNPVLVLTDGAIGQMMEKVELPEPYKFRSAEDMRAEKPWATNGKKGREKNVLTSLNIKSEDMEKKNNELQAKYQKIASEEVRYEAYNLDDADIVISAYGLSSRLCKKVVDLGREKDMKIGLLRPITLWPFPVAKFDALADNENIKHFFSIEMSVGQMVEDIKLVVNGRKPVSYYGRTGGILPTAEEILNVINDKM